MNTLKHYTDGSYSLKDYMIYLKYYFVNSGYRLFYAKLTGKKPNLKKYAGKEILEPEYGNDYIRDMIVDGKPFMAGRFGSGELRAFVEGIGVKLNIRTKIKNTTLDALCTNAGFFPRTQEAAKKFTEFMANACQHADLIGVWLNIMEDYVIRIYARNAKLSMLRAIEPYYHDIPWSSALAGKKVLVIHPFQRSILSQYKKREFLFTNKNILPEFELKTLKAVQTIAGERSKFRTWFDALDYMVDRALSMEFDVAIIGCGAYGFPIAAKLKKAGKQAVHMGGATQILFGIKGKRWDNHPEISKLYNKYWVRPLPEETPINSDKIEGGCYW